MRKVFRAAGRDEQGVQRTRIKIEEFGAAIRLGEGQEVEGDEVECLVANMIYKVRTPPLHARKCAVFRASRSFLDECLL